MDAPRLLALGMADLASSFPVGQLILCAGGQLLAQTLGTWLMLHAPLVSPCCACRRCSMMQRQLNSGGRNLTHSRQLQTHADWLQKGALQSVPSLLQHADVRCTVLAPC
jgi:hypothetical protein